MPPKPFKKPSKKRVKPPSKKPSKKLPKTRRLARMAGIIGLAALSLSHPAKTFSREIKAERIPFVTEYKTPLSQEFLFEVRSVLRDNQVKKLRGLTANQIRDCLFLELDHEQLSKLYNYLLEYGLNPGKEMPKMIYESLKMSI
ncbi:MAG: hypothetical protein ABH821_00040 [archaeon]